MKMPKISIPRIKNPVGVIDSIVTIAGIIFIVVGIHQIYKPAAWITAGAILAFPGIPKKGVK